MDLALKTDLKQDWVAAKGDSNGNAFTSLGTALSGERNIGAAAPFADYLVTQREWNITVFNPRAASSTTTRGAAGSAGTTEVLVASAAVIVGGIVTENDTTAANILLRDVSALATSASARALTATLNTCTVFELDWIFSNGLAIIASDAGCMFTVKWKLR